MEMRNIRELEFYLNRNTSLHVYFELLYLKHVVKKKRRKRFCPQFATTVGTCVSVFKLPRFRTLRTLNSAAVRGSLSAGVSQPRPRSVVYTECRAPACFNFPAGLISRAIRAAQAPLCACVETTPPLSLPVSVGLVHRFGANGTGEAHRVMSEWFLRNVS